MYQFPLTVTHDDFNGSLGDLGGDGESLEERSLLGTEAGVLGRHNDVQRRDGSDTGRGFHLKNNITSELIMRNNHGRGKRGGGGGYDPHHFLTKLFARFHSRFSNSFSEHFEQ